MLVVKDINKHLESEKPRAISLGFFDGVHIGHRDVISAASVYADTNTLAKAVFTFSLPADQNLKGNLILQPQTKYALLDSLGVQYCFEPDFEKISGFSARDFFKKVLLQSYNAKAIFCGHDFRFGAKRSGNVDLLTELCAQNGVYLGLVPTTLYETAQVSSSRIRKELSEGRIEKVNAMLGEEYKVRIPITNVEYCRGILSIEQCFPQYLKPPAIGKYNTKSLLGGEWCSSVTFIKQKTGDKNMYSVTNVEYPSKDFVKKDLTIKFCSSID